MICYLNQDWLGMLVGTNGYLIKDKDGNCIAGGHEDSDFKTTAFEFMK